MRYAKTKEETKAFWDRATAEEREAIKEVLERLHEEFKFWILKISLLPGKWSYSFGYGMPDCDGLTVKEVRQVLKIKAKAKSK